MIYVVKKNDEFLLFLQPGKAKGVSGLIEVENPNRVVKKVKKLSTLNETIKDTPKPELSR